MSSIDFPGKWRRFSPSQLLTLSRFCANEEEFVGFTGRKNCSAIYIWRLCTQEIELNLVEKELFLEQFLKFINNPIYVIRDRKTSSYVKIDQLTIGGSPLTTKKLEDLNKLSNSKAWRKYLMKYLDSLSPFFPPIYIGKTTNLFKRISSHLSGSSNLLKYFEEEVGCDVSFLEMQYLEVGENLEFDYVDVELLGLLENIAQKLFFAPSVIRQG